MGTQLEIFRSTLSREADRIGFTLSPGELDALALHYGLLCKWNLRARLTAAIAPERAAIELFADCLAACAFVDSIANDSSAASLRVIDIGAGAGLPGIPLKILRPEWHLTIIESNTKKASFIKTLQRELNLQKINARKGRAETIAHEPDLRECFDLAFCRAVGIPEMACELAIPFLEVGGTFIAQTIIHPSDVSGTIPVNHDPEPDKALKSIEAVSKILSATIIMTKCYTLSGVAVSRRLIAIQKIAPTPSCYPRDPRTIKKKPLKR